jgi:hypothetical protein
MGEEYLTIAEVADRLNIKPKMIGHRLYNPVGRVKHLKSLTLFRSVPALCPLESE